MKKAAALKYDKQTQNAPKVIAKGKGEIADRIIQKAKEFDIAIFSNKELVDTLLDIDIDKEIPPRLYEAVVEVFVWLTKQDKRLR